MIAPRPDPTAMSAAGGTAALPSTSNQGKEGSQEGVKVEKKEDDTRKRGRPCRYYIRGWCKAGNGCPFMHSTEDERETKGGDRWEGDWTCTNCRRSVFGKWKWCLCGQEKPSENEKVQDKDYWERKAEKRKKDRQEAEDKERKTRRLAENTKKELERAKKDADGAHKAAGEADQDCSKVYRELKETREKLEEAVNENTALKKENERLEQKLEQEVAQNVRMNKHCERLEAMVDRWEKINVDKHKEKKKKEQGSSIKRE